MHSVRLAPTLLTLTLAGAALAAPPEIPDQVPYSAVVPGGGAGPVDLTLRIYDAAASGTLLYVQDFADVPLVDGAFTLALGPTGRATDAPTDPLTTSLVAALAGDLAATAPGRFVEVTVNTDPPLPRERVLAVPFALRAASAASAETAESANSVTHVGGVPPEVRARSSRTSTSATAGLRTAIRARAWGTSTATASRTSSTPTTTPTPSPTARKWPRAATST